MVNEFEIKKQICDIGRRIYNRNMVAANDGNISVKLNDNEFLCTPTGVSKGFMTPEFICKVDAQGNVIPVSYTHLYSSTVKVEQSVSLEDTCVLENTAEIEEELWKTYECRKTTADNSHCIVFTPHPEEKKIYRSAYATEQVAEYLLPLLYGNIAETTSTLGAAGIRVPGTAGETTEGLLDKYGIPSLIMADGPAGIRLQQHYEVDRATAVSYTHLQ